MELVVSNRACVLVELRKYLNWEMNGYVDVIISVENLQ